MIRITAHKADGTKVVGTVFKDYPSRFKKGDILDNVNNVIRGETVYKKV